MRNDYQNAITDNFGVYNEQGIEINAPEEKRLDTNYTCKDQNWHTDKFQGDIYMSVPNQTYELLEKHYKDPTNPEYMLPERGFPGTINDINILGDRAIEKIGASCMI